jgi:hypothetical protein
MMYASPELVVIGRADVLVLGSTIPGLHDAPGRVTKPDMGLVLGLDD